MEFSSFYTKKELRISSISPLWLKYRFPGTNEIQCHQVPPFDHHIPAKVQCLRFLFQVEHDHHSAMRNV